jgi:hypothetical protein
MKGSVLLIFLLYCLSSFSQDADWLTYYEKSGFNETPRYAETMAYCDRLDAASDWVTVKSFGESAQGRSLPLIVVDNQGFTSPGQIHRSGKALLLIQACIHPGECEGKDAGLMLIRDLVISRKYPGLLDHVSILFIPIFNTDGHERFGPYNRINQNGPKEMGWRVTANNLNLNRDFLKAETPEMQAWLGMFNEWMPDFFIDTHTTDGADYQYVLTYLMEIFGNMDDGLTDWCRSRFLPAMTGKMENKGLPVFPYIEFRDWHNPKSGLESNVAPPMLSQGYTSLRNRPGLLIETHMLKPYKTRVSSTYECILSSLEIIDKEYSDLISLVKKADEITSGKDFRATDFPLQFETLTTDSTMVDFRGIKYEEVKSELTGETWFKYGTEKTSFQLPYFSVNRPSVSTKLPEAYIVPVEWTTVLEKLVLHGVKLHYLAKDTIIRVDTYKLTSPKWNATSYEGHHALYQFETSMIKQDRLFCKGSAIVDMNQPQARIIAQLLEPKGNGSLVYWGYFDAILEQKEYAEHYVMEVMIPQMLKENPQLKMEFGKKEKEDTLFAKNPNLILNWFFSKTPYWDRNRDIYPVGKIYDRKFIDSLLKSCLPDKEIK